MKNSKIAVLLSCKAAIYLGDTIQLWIEIFVYNYMYLYIDKSRIIVYNYM